MQLEDRKKGLCFYCKDKWHVGHQCKVPKIFLIDGFQLYNQGSDQEVPLEDGSIEEVVSTKLEQQMVGSVKITLYALLGSPSPRTMRV